MAKPKTASWSKLLIYVGDGATPTEVFVLQCGLTSKGINFTGDTSDIAVPDCDNPDLPAWSESVITVMNCSISGDGVLATDKADEWFAWFTSGVARNCRVEQAIPLADGGGKYEGKFLLTTFTHNANQDDAMQTVAVEMRATGPVTWTPAVATALAA